MSIISIEVPLYEVMGFYDGPKKLISPKGIHFMLYAGYPGSPLNGGRSNGKVDDQRFQSAELKKGTWFKRNEEDIRNLRRLQDYFIECIQRANQEGVGVQLTYTNYFCVDSELNEVNARPVRAMMESNRKTGVQNRFIVANEQIENWILSMGAERDDLIYSCTRFYFPDRKLSRVERLAAYHKAAQDYGIVVLTPPDANLPEQLVGLERDDLPKFAAVINSPCIEACNSYWHYATHSLWNIVTGSDPSSPQYPEFFRQYQEISKRNDNHCTREFNLADLERKVDILLSKGIRILKVARGHSQKILSDLLKSLSNGS